MCRSCGHIDPADSRGRCPACGMFFELAIVPRLEAEQIARQWRRRVLRRRLVRLTVVLVVVGGATIWALGAYFDLGPRPPSATTNISASIGPHTWGQIGRTPDNSGFTPEAAPFPQHVAWTYRTSKPLLASPAVVDSYVYLTTGDGRTIALDRHTGQTVWEFYTGWLSNSTPAVAGDAVVFAIRPGRVVSLDRTDRRAALGHQHENAYLGFSCGGERHGLYWVLGQEPLCPRCRHWTATLGLCHPGLDCLRRGLRGRSGHRGFAGQPPACGRGGNGRQRLVYETGIGRHIGAAPAVHGGTGVLLFCRGPKCGP